MNTGTIKMQFVVIYSSKGVLRVAHGMMEY